MSLTPEQRERVRRRRGVITEFRRSTGISAAWQNLDVHMASYDGWEMHDRSVHRRIAHQARYE